MKYIIVKGNQNSGKHTTIKEVCRQLNPDRVLKATVNEDGSVKLHDVYTVENMQDKTYILHTKGKKVLVLAGTPTQQQLTVSRIVSCIKAASLHIDFAIVAVSTYERMKGFATCNELSALGSHVTDIKVSFIPSHRYAISQEWQKRINYLTGVTRHYV